MRDRSPGSARARFLGLGVAGLLGAGLLGACLGACHFDIDGVLIPASDGGTEDMSLGGDGMVDLGQQDLAGLCMPGGPTSGCSPDGEFLLTCQGGTSPQETLCTDGCSTDPVAHCRRLDPGGVAAPSDYELAGLMDITLTSDAVFNTDTGAITTSGIDRPGGGAVQAGIGFRAGTQADGSGVGIFSFKTLIIDKNTKLAVVGAKPMVLVASGDITVDGVIDGQGQCSSTAGVGGGGAGGTPKAGNGGAGGGVGGGGGGLFVAGTLMIPSNSGGGGGGGFGDVGGVGATAGGSANLGGAAGALFGDFTVADPVIVGGGGGGAGGGASAGGAGGPGGGAVQIASNAQVNIGADAVITVGGCHGNKSGGSGGGGGGAGGLIFIEARAVVIGSGAILAANGGSGAGGNGSDGKDGPADLGQATGGNGGSNGSKGGDGGHTGMLSGRAGEAPQNSDTAGGGGGGSVGRIALKSKSGMVDTSSAKLSPDVNDVTPSRPIPPSSARRSSTEELGGERDRGGAAQEPRGDLVLLRVDRLHRDAELGGDLVRFALRSEVQGHEVAVAGGELAGERAERIAALAHDEAVERARLVGAALRNLGELVVRRPARDAAQEVVGRVGGDEPEPGAELHAAVRVEGAQPA